ncbi:MAG: acetyltransferase [Firmicutes bacterium]|nr:acetyltransferase [Bacillota bacterium]
MSAFPLTAGSLTIRPLIPEDVAPLRRWLTTPEVLAYYEGRDRPHTEEMVRERYLSKTGEPVQGLLILWWDAPAGYLQVYPLSMADCVAYGYEPGLSVFGMDLFIGEPSLWNQGIGTAVVMEAAHALFTRGGAQRLVVDPRVENDRAVHVYKKCGFAIQKRLVRHEHHEGAWHDCWLMEKRA